MEGYPKKTFKDDIAAENPKAMLADGLDECILGIGHRCGHDPLAVYDYAACVLVFMNRDGMTRDDAVEWMEFNVVGSGGEGYPIFLHMREGIEIRKL